MPSQVYRGLSVPVLKSQDWDWDQSSGYTMDQQYDGFDVSAMVRLANWYNSYGVTSHLHLEGGRATLITKDATGNYTIDKWEMAVDQSQPSIFENTLFNTLISDGTGTAAATVTDKSKVITMLRIALENSNPTNSASAWNGLTQNPLITYETDGDGNVTTSSAGNTEAAEFLAALGADFTGNTAKMKQLKQYFDDYNLGVTNFISGRYTLRHTTNAPNRWSANVADFNVEKVYTIAQLLSEVQNANLWVLPLPGYLAYKIANYFIPNLRGKNYVWGALKERSSAVTAANNRIEITTEYLIDQINTNLYPMI
jgi:hypothetical protein